MKKFTLSFCLFLIFNLAYSQHPSDKWLFGLNAGIDFQGAGPVTYTASMMNASEGCSSISDANGDLLFYTDGITVWDKNHGVMPNGTGLLGGLSSSQPAVIVPSPSNVAQYYIFTTDDLGGIDAFNYSVVDMSLSAGMGSVTIKNTQIVNSVIAEKVTAVKDPNSNRYWILTHGFNDNLFYAFSLSSVGLSNPVVTSIGSVHSGSMMQNSYGQMKFNPCGNKVGLAIGYMNLLELFEFNTTTGAVTNSVSLPMTDHVYGVEFSPDGSKFYASTYDPFQTLLQFDVSVWTPSLIAASQTSISTTPDIYPLQLAKDGKIYVVKSNSQWVGAINFPNATGAACTYTDMAIDLDPNSQGTHSNLSLPAFVQSLFLPGAGGCPTVSDIHETTYFGFNSLIYPNPTAAEFTFKAEAPSTITVYSCRGELIETLQSKTETVSFGKNYSAGIYFVKTESKGETRYLKIVKE